MAVQSEIGLIEELERLRAELRRREREAADKELQLERYAADLRETFKQERARAQELRRSYMATVRALSNAVEARDAYTGKHAERVAAYGLEIAREVPRRADPTARARVRLPAARHRQGRHSRRDPLQAGPADRRRARADGTAPGDRRRRSCRGSSSWPTRPRWCAPTTSAGTATATPTGWSARSIPLAARVFSVADVLDALTTDRPYRPASLAALRARDDHRGERAPSSTPVWWTRSTGSTISTFERIAAEIR